MRLSLTSFIAMATVLRWFSVRTTMAQPKRIPLGALFNAAENDWNESLEAFRYHVEKHNNQTMAPFKLEMYEKIVDITNSYQMIRAECSVVSKGIFAFIGMMNSVSANSAESFASTVHMPYVTPNAPHLKHPDDVIASARVDPSVGDGHLGGGEGRGGGYMMYLRPLYFRAVIDVIRYLSWKRFFYVYDSYEGLITMENLFALLNDGDRQMEIQAVHLPNPANCYSVLRGIDSQSPGQNKHILLDIATDDLLQAVLNQILHLGMHKTGYDYVLGGLAMDELDLSIFKFGGVNLTGFRLVDPEVESNEATLNDWKKELGRGSRQRGRMTLTAALTMDAVQVVVRGLTTLFVEDPDIIRRSFRHGHVFNGERRGIQCKDPPDTWIHGPIIAQHFRKVRFSGLTGPVSFDSSGLRKDFNLHIFSLGFDQPLRKIGTWNESFGMFVPRDERDNVGTRKNHLAVIVTSVLEPPYLMLKKEKTDDGKPPAAGNARYEGLCADLTKKIADIVKFEYVLREVADGNYGVKTANGSWNGMIGELLKDPNDPGMADIAVAPLTISSARERVVDFTKPFMNLGISIMIKKPEKQKPGVFSFMDPLSIDIWTCIVFSYLGVSFTLFLIGRISPDEWQVEEEEGGNKVTVSTDFNLLNSLWFSLGAFMQQGCDISPRSMSGRLAGSSWWFFTLILISSYTANLAAFLTVERMLTPINSADDLVKQSEILYGTRMNGSTREFFETSNIPVYHQMWNVMRYSLDRTIFPPTTDAGVMKVRTSKGKYAFFLESTMNEYHNQKKPCNTIKVGENLDSKGYGVATRIGHPLRVDIGLAVLQLLENGEIAKLQKKWWIDKGECPSDSESKGGSFQSALSLSNVAGIFYILIGGLGLAMLISFFEFLSKSFAESKRKKKLISQSEASSGSHCSKFEEPAENVLGCSKTSKSMTLITRPLTSRPNTVSLV